VPNLAELSYSDEENTMSSELYGSLPNLIPMAFGPSQPTATLMTSTTQAEERFEKRLTRIREILPISKGRVVPSEDDLMIGDARRLHLAVMFLDICKFSQMESTEDAEQDNVLTLLNLFMAEMLSVVKRHEGDFEKNTGDGLMAYFAGPTLADCAKRALDAAITMHHYNDHVISPRLEGLSLPRVKFRVAIETGSVVIANVGIKGGERDHRSLVAIGTTANVACKLMRLLPDGGIVLGSAARGHLTKEWQGETTLLGTLDGYVFKGTQTPYPAYLVKYRAPYVPNLYGALAALGGR
jgi:adenylate cyclase